MVNNNNWKLLSFFLIAITLVTSTVLLQAKLNVQSIELLPAAIAQVIADENTVNSAAIIDGEVRRADIANGAVGTLKLGANAVRTSNIGNSAVTTPKIADGAVTSDKLAPNVFDAMQAQIDALTTENAAQQDQIDDLMARVTVLEGGGGGSDPNVDDDSDGFTENQGDCDDTNAAVNPDAPEMPSNGIDDDCGGMIDETEAVPGAGEVVINEVDYDQDGTDITEFIELYNTGTTSFDLNGLSLVRWTGTGVSLTLVTFSDVVITPGGFVLIASDSFSGGLVTPAARFPDSSLVNSAGSAVQFVNGATILDAIQYGTGSNLSLGEGSPAPTEGGTFESLIRFPDGTDTNDNSADFVVTTGLTPGSANFCC